MVDSSASQSPYPHSLPPPPSPPPALPPAPPPPSPPQNPSLWSFSFPRPAFRLTSEFDSDNLLFYHKISCRLFDRLAKLKVSFQNNRNGQVTCPRLGFITKHLSILYDVEDKNAFVKGSLDVGKDLQFRAFRDIKGEHGEVAMIATLGEPSYKMELSSFVPSAGLPRATFLFPRGEVSLEQIENAEAKRVLSVNGLLKGQIMNGVCTALYKNNDLNFRYSYKDEEMSFIPSICLLSKAVSLAFKRRFSPSDKLSYLYHFHSNDWSAVYKHTVGKDLKVKAGYDSEVRIGWASLLVGNEDGKAKTAPMKMKVQFMLQVPHDDIKNSALLFRVKKRWDF